jgi:hypothetical protein
MGQMISSFLPVLTAGSAGAGAFGNILSMIQQGQQFSKLKSFENMSPQQLAAKVSAGTQPLNAGLVQSVTNQVQGADAERGLATSPGIFNADLAQSLAPFQQQNQNTALQLFLQQMGLPVQASSLLRTQPLNNSFANLFKTMQANQPSTVPSDPNSFMDLIWGPSGSGGGGGTLTDSPIDYSGGGSTAGANA